MVPISINGSVSVSGEAEACLFLCNFEPAFDSFSFSSSNTQPVYSFSQSQQALAVYPFFDATSEADASALQSLSIGTLSLGTSLELDDSGSAYPLGLHAHASTSSSDVESIAFLVSGPALAHLKGQVSLFITSAFSTVDDVSLLLTGPGNQSILFLSLPGPADSFDETLLFLPGTYNLSVFANLDDFALSGETFLDSATVSFDAEFTPVPEPRGMPIILSALLAVLLTWGARITRVIRARQA